MYRLGILAFLCFSQMLQAQTFTFKIIDSSTGEAIPFASIQTGPSDGTISNEEGVFSLQNTDLQSPFLKISSMGYQTLKIPQDNLKAYSDIIFLEPAVIQLNEVQLGGKVPEVDEIIARTNKNLNQNYPDIKTNYELFYRETSGMHFNELIFELEKDSDLSRANIKKADSELRKLAYELSKQDQRSFIDLSGSMALDTDSTALLEIKAIRQLIDPNQEFDIDKIQERAKALFTRHLDTSKTYLLKSGIFKIEDSLNPKAEFGPSNSDSIEIKSLNERLTSLTGGAAWKSKSRLHQFLNTSLYRYKLQKATYFDGNYVYAITFFPKSGKALYTGTLYIDTISFGVLRVNYEYAPDRNGKKVNLKLILGIRFEENESSGIAIFRKDQTTNKLHPYLIQESYGNLIYLHRDLKFIARGPANEKVKFDFVMDANYTRSSSIWLKPKSDMESTPYLHKKIKVEELNRFDKEKWQNYFGLEPVGEMKRFGLETN